MTNPAYWFIMFLFSENLMKTEKENFLIVFSPMIPDQRCKCWKCESEEGREEHFQRKKSNQNCKKRKLGSFTKTCAPSSCPWKGKNDLGGRGREDRTSFLSNFTFFFPLVGIILRWSWHHYFYDKLHFFQNLINRL